MNDEIQYEPAISHPLVTVITATFNLVEAGRADDIRECIKSVHAQRYRPIEHLIIDGASTDGTLELLREYEEKGWITVHSEPDKGIYDAFNKGIDLAKGKYCAFMNSDDLWHDTQGIEMSIHMLEIGKGDFSYAPATYIFPDGKVLLSEPDMAAFTCYTPCNHQTMFYRTDLLREYRYDSEHYRMLADCDLTTRLLLSGRKGVYVPLNFTTFRMGGFSGDELLKEKEYTRLFRRYYGPLIGKDAANAMWQQVVPSKLLNAVASLVHPDILELMKRYFTIIPGGDAELRALRPNRLDYHHIVKQHQVPEGPVCRVERWRGLFGLPLLEMRHSPGRLRVRLFGCLPIWKRITRADGSQKHYLFTFIPMWEYTP